jgi:putative tricarboxylic transport membrane protein
MLAFGIPGDAVTAVILGGLLIQGVTPGVQLFRESGEIVHPLFIGYFLAYIVVLLLGLGFLPWFAKLARIDRAMLFPWIAAVSIVAAFVAQRTLAAMWLTLGIGALGYLMRRFGYPLVPVLMGLLLGPMLESSFRRALIVSDHGPLIFITSPISAVLLLAAVLLVLYFRYIQPRS